VSLLVSSFHVPAISFQVLFHLELCQGLRGSEDNRGGGHGLGPVIITELPHYTEPMKGPQEAAPTKLVNITIFTLYRHFYRATPFIIGPVPVKGGIVCVPSGYSLIRPVNMVRNFVENSAYHPDPVR